MRFLLIASLFVVVACGDLKTGMTNAKDAETAIAAAVGGDPKIGVRINNGHLLVTVFFKQLPTKNLSLSELKAALQPIVAANFEKKVEGLTISF